jgi:hypothetical protein
MTDVASRPRASHAVTRARNGRGKGGETVTSARAVLVRWAHARGRVGEDALATVQASTRRRGVNARSAGGTARGLP